mmetsp:Transcript_17716/g.35351  ORF Transcript_17716/g.35351 Transcript_17716/m.35351 type:complete len:539 (-) Transcript_17716:504-2120(-)
MADLNSRLVPLFLLLASLTDKEKCLCVAQENTTRKVPQNCTIFSETGECQAPWRGDQSTSIKLEDLSSECAMKASNGYCNYDPEYMLEHCVASCLTDPTLGSIGYFEEGDQLDEECEDRHNLQREDEHYTCEEYVEDGECWKNPEYMLKNCAKSCVACIIDGTETFNIGVSQGLREEDISNNQNIMNIVQVIAETDSYMKGVMLDREFDSVRLTCRNKNKYCASLAAAGFCEAEYGDDLGGNEGEESLYNFMMKECAPACQSCGLLYDEDLIWSCTPDTETNVFGEGDLNHFFKRVVGEASFEGVIVPEYYVNIHSRPAHPENGKSPNEKNYHLGPWIVTLDGFLTDEECDRLKQLGSLEGYARSELEDADAEDDTYRTSTNSWCQNECSEDPVAQKVIEKISNLTGIPDSFSEYLQLLKYVPGQYYKEHHDYGQGESDFVPGPRMITLFLYLNDVEEGGATRFTEISKGISVDIHPKKGTALIWPNVLDRNPLEMDRRTFHEALPVIKGVKYGANAWLHMRDFKNDYCDYDGWELIN